MAPGREQGHRWEGDAAGDLLGMGQAQNSPMLPLVGLDQVKVPTEGSGEERSGHCFLLMGWSLRSFPDATVPTGLRAEPSSQALPLSLSSDT